MKFPKNLYSKLYNYLGRYYGEKLEGVIGPLIFNLSKAYCSLSLRFQPEIYSLSINGNDSKFFLSKAGELYTLKMNFFSERVVYEDLISSIKSEDVFYDVGAHIGTYTCFAAQKIKEGRVFAFEPFPKNVERLRENVQLNDLKVDVIPLALLNSNGVEEMEIEDDEPGASINTFIQEGNGDKKSIEIKTRRGDYLINKGEILPPDVIKIDVEGTELEVLKGLEENLEGCRLIYCEVHSKELKQNNDSPQELFNFLSRKGFETETILERGTNLEIKAKRKK